MSIPGLLVKSISIIFQRKKRTAAETLPSTRYLQDTYVFFKDYWSKCYSSHVTFYSSSRETYHRLFQATWANIFWHNRRVLPSTESVWHERETYCTHRRDLWWTCMIYCTLGRVLPSTESVWHECETHSTHRKFMNMLDLKGHPHSRVFSLPRPKRPHPKSKDAKGEGDLCWYTCSLYLLEGKI